jgi:hypothetical protein
MSTGLGAVLDKSRDGWSTGSEPVRRFRVGNDQFGFGRLIGFSHNVNVPASAFCEFPNHCEARPILARQPVLE